MVNDAIGIFIGYGWIISTKQKEHDYYKYCHYDRFNSMEQLWLAFVMKEKYGKVWNGEDWVTTNE